MHKLWKVRDVMNGGEDILFSDRPFSDCVTYAHNYIWSKTNSSAVDNTDYLHYELMPKFYMSSDPCSTYSSVVLLCVEPVR